MKRNKGFTLVELLAVIVILAVIALIATPVVLSMIESSRKGAAESSMLSYTQAVENTILTKMMNSTTSVNYDQVYSAIGLTLTSATKTETKDEAGNVTAVTITPRKACINTEGNADADCAGENGNPGTGQKINNDYVVVTVDLKGDQPEKDVAGSYIKVTNNAVTEAKLKFGKYYVSYFYDKTTGTTDYCSKDDAFVASAAACQANK